LSAAVGHTKVEKMRKLFPTFAKENSELTNQWLVNR